MHSLAQHQRWDPFPPLREGDIRERREANRAIGASAVGLAVTGALELVIALLSGSVGLLGDALHNLSDVSTSAVVWLGFRISRRPATPSHPYGFERAEDLAGLGVSLVIWTSAGFAAYASFHKLVAGGTTSHLPVAVAGAVVGVVGNLLVARYKLVVGRRINSATLVGDARHSWLDGFSSLGALTGLIGVAVGARWADPVAGLVVTLLILRVGWEVTREMLGHLMDSVAPGTIAAAEQAASIVPLVQHAHVRARWMGRTLLVEVEGFVREGTTVSEAERVGTDIEAAVLAAVPEARAVTWAPRSMPAL